MPGQELILDMLKSLRDDVSSLRLGLRKAEIDRFELIQKGPKPSRRYLVDGSKALAEQENDLNGVEMTTLSTTTQYLKQPGGSIGTTKNQASMIDAATAFRPIYLASVAVGAETSEVVAQQKTAGRNLIFTGTAYVSGAEMTVMGFRQP